MMSNNFSGEKCDTNDNQNKSVNPWTRDEKRSPGKKKVEYNCNNALLKTNSNNVFTRFPYFLVSNITNNNSNNSIKSSII